MKQFTSDYDYDSPTDDANHVKLNSINGFWSWFDADDPIASRAAVGLWEPGQTQPTGEQEYEWELANTITAGSSNRGGRIKLDRSAEATYTRNIMKF